MTKVMRGLASVAVGVLVLVAGACSTTPEPDVTADAAVSEDASPGGTTDAVTGDDAAVLEGDSGTPRTSDAGTGGAADTAAGVSDTGTVSEPDVVVTPDGETPADVGPADAGQAQPEFCEGVQPGAAPVRLLTRTEYDHTVRDLLGVDTAPAHAFPPENEALGFLNNAEAHVVNPLLVESYLAAAEAVATEALAAGLASVAPCAAELLESADATEIGTCRDAWIAELGRRAFRRPLTVDEAAVFAATFDAARAEGESLSGAVEWTLQALLMAPQFLYRVQELSPDEVVGAAVPLTAFELASRLSYFLWTSTPDAELLAAAESGALVTDAGLTAEAQRLLDDPRAAGAIDDFHRQWLHLEALEHEGRDLPEGLLDGTGFEGVTSVELAESWQKSVLAFARAAVLDGGGFDAMLSSTDVHMDPLLALLYPEAGGVDEGVAAFPADQRSGLLTQPGMMALLANAAQSSPIRRGIFVREKLMCETLAPPPPEVNITPPDPDPNATTRERFEQHTEDPFCAGCHFMIDPVGFGFESYDHLGRHRLEENGLPVDATGEVLGAWGDPELNGPFDGAVELSAKLVASPQVRDCVVTQWYRYAMGRGDAAEADQCNVSVLKWAFAQSGGDVRSLLLEIVMTDAFRLRPGIELVAAEPLPPEEELPDLTEPPVVDPPVFEEPDPPVAGDPNPQSPLGFFDGISDSGVASGWTLDPNAPTYPLFVEVYVDGNQIEPRQRADKPRPDVNEVTGYPGDHGFVFMLPGAALDGGVHTINLIAQDVGDSGNKTLNNSPKTFQLGGGVTTPAHGVIDAVSAAGVANGWAFDPDDPPPDATVRLYLDAPGWAGGALLGETSTGASPRPDVDAFYSLASPANSGWSFQIPESAMDGQPHVLFAEVVDVNVATVVVTLNPTAGKAFQLGGAP